MKIFYLSVASFAQADVSVINRLKQKNEIQYCLLFPKTNAHYAPEEIAALIGTQNVNFDPVVLKMRWRDLRLILIFWKIIRKIQRSGADAVYVAELGHPYFSILAFLLNAKKTIIGLHDVQRHSSYEVDNTHTLSRVLLMKKFQNFQVFSAEQGRIFTEKYPGKTLSVLSLPLTPVKTAREKIASRKNYDLIRFLFFGKILTYKGVDHLIAAVNRLSEHYSNFELTIAGHCPDWDRDYEPLVQAGSRIRKMIRFIDNSEIEELFLQAHYLVLPYKDVTQSGPMMIAYSYRVPVIISNLSEFDQFFSPGETGYSFDRNSKDGLYRCMESAVVRPESSYLMLRETMEKFVETRFSTENTLCKFEAMFAGLAKLPVQA